jgi:hypothetical protein
MKFYPVNYCSKDNRMCLRRTRRERRREPIIIEWELQLQWIPPFEWETAGYQKERRQEKESVLFDELF